MLPRLLYERLPELGIDVSVIYPSFGLLFRHFDDERDRRGACRALNRFNADVFAEFADRLLPVAEIPMHTPEEAVDELEHAAVARLPGGRDGRLRAASRSRPPSSVDPELAQYAVWTDTFGLDSAYDYDPVWQKCRELGIAPAFHSAAMGWQNRASISSYVYNHVGMLGESHHARRPSRCSSAASPGASPISTSASSRVAWRGRRRSTPTSSVTGRSATATRMRRLDPANVDWDEFADLFDGTAASGRRWPRAHDLPGSRTVALLDEFAACGIERAEDIHDLFVAPFFCGCEADDPMTVTAFNTKVNPFGARLQRHVRLRHLALGRARHGRRARRGLRDGRARACSPTADLRDFVFTNPVRFYTRGNPEFFDGTAVEARGAHRSCTQS